MGPQGRPQPPPRKAWALEGVRFAMQESSKRPAMAFVSFTRELEEA